MNRIAVFGDVHGHLDKMIEMMKADEIDFALQAGDFGAYLPTSNFVRAVWRDRRGSNSRPPA